MSGTRMCWQAVLGASLMTCLGCQWGGQSLPSDPLFVLRKPIEAKAELAPPVAVVCAEPTMPLDPVAYARREGTKNVPGVLTSVPGRDQGPSAPALIPPKSRK